MRAPDRVIRPPDPLVTGLTMLYAPYSSQEACRRLIDLCFRDALTALDLTYSVGGFWGDPLPPGLSVTQNRYPGCPSGALSDEMRADNPLPCACSQLHVDFTSTGLPDASYDLVVYDPPHIADGGEDGIMAGRYGTVKGTEGLQLLIQGGALEAWRLSRVGILVKVADHSHGGRYLQLSRWIEHVIPVAPYTYLHTYRARHLSDPKHQVQRTPRSNGAIYLVFRRSGGAHQDFTRLYERQEQRRRKDATR